MDLRARLQELKTSLSPSRQIPQSRVVLPYLVPLENTLGITYYTDKIYIERHGEIDFTNFPELPSDSLRFLSFERCLDEHRSQDFIFLDIETTGTAGGAGTLAFLIGLGFIEKGYFQVRQFFLHDLAQEPAFLQAVADFSARFACIVTYNGKCFDTQIIRTRYRLHRMEDPFSNKQHIDMLFVARRLWKKRFIECELTSLEKNVLQFQRVDDIPSFLIPSAYTDYLRFARDSMIQQVLRHNQWDIASLAVLTARACRMMEQYNELSADEHFAMSLLHERHKRFTRAVEHQLMALTSDTRYRYSLLLALSRNLRRIKDLNRMRALLDLAGNEMLDSELCKRLSILCEHDLKDYELALRFVEMHIARTERFQMMKKKYCPDSEWRKRRDRLLRKLRSVPLI